MQERTLRITEQVTEDEGTPLLKLAGAWLEAAGFPVEALVEVEVVEPGRLVVTRVEEEGVELGKLLPLVWIPAERLAAIEESVRESAESGEAAHA